MSRYKSNCMLSFSTASSPPPSSVPSQQKLSAKTDSNTSSISVAQDSRGPIISPMDTFMSLGKEKSPSSSAALNTDASLVGAPSLTQTATTSGSVSIQTPLSLQTSHQDNILKQQIQHTMQQEREQMAWAAQPKSVALGDDVPTQADESPDTLLHDILQSQIEQHEKQEIENETGVPSTDAPLKLEQLLFTEIHNLLETHNGYDAYEIISQFIEEHPDVPFLYRYRAQTHVAMRSYYDALRDLDKAIESGTPRTAEYDQSLYERALVKAFLNRPISATSDIKNIHDKRSKKVLTLAAWLNDSSDIALSYLDSAFVKEQQMNERAAQELDVETNNDTDQILPTTPAPQSDEDTMWFLFIRAKNLELSGQYEEAFKTYKDAAKCNNGELQLAWQKAALCCQRMNRHLDAITYFNKYLAHLKHQEKHKIYYETLFSRAYSFFALQQWDLASSDYEVIIKHSNNRRFNSYALINRGFLNFHLGHYAASLLDVRGAIMHDPTNIAAYHIRCHVYEHTRRNTLAKNDIQAILELIHNRREYADCPKRFIGQLYVKLARLYLEDPPTRHTFADAMHNVDKALECEPQLEEALEMRIHIYMKQYSVLLQKDPDTEEQHNLVMRDLNHLIHSSTDSSPENPPDRFYYTRGMIHYQNARYSEAELDFGRCKIGEVGGWSLIYYQAKVDLFQWRPLRSSQKLYNGWKKLKQAQQAAALH